MGTPFGLESGVLEPSRCESHFKSGRLTQQAVRRVGRSIDRVAGLGQRLANAEAGARVCTPGRANSQGLRLFGARLDGRQSAEVRRAPRRSPASYSRITIRRCIHSTSLVSIAGRRPDILLSPKAGNRASGVSSTRVICAHIQFATVSLACDHLKTECTAYFLPRNVLISCVRS